MKRNFKIGGFGNIRESFKTKQVKYGGYAAVVTLAVIAGLILLNLLVGSFSPQIDLTWSKRFSLSEQTLHALDRLTKPVKLYGLWQPGEEDPEVLDVINLYLARNKNITLELIDPDRNPGFVMRYDMDKRGIVRRSLIVEGDMGFRVIAPSEMYDFTENQYGGTSVIGVAVERRITSAILFAGTGTTPVVYEMTGLDETPLALFGLHEILERDNFTLRQINLQLNPVPEDASVIVLHRPQRDLTGSEADKLLDYLDAGGRLFALVDYQIREYSNLNRVLASYGLRYEYGIVVELDPSYTVYEPRIVWPDIAEHDITVPLMNKERTPVILSEAMALAETETKRRTVEITPLMASSSRAILRTDLNDTATGGAPPSGESLGANGPHIFGAAVTDPSWIDPNNPEPQARIVAIACGTLLHMYTQGFEANMDLFMNSLTWLGDKSENITVRSKSILTLPMRMNFLQVMIFGAVFIVVIPLCFFISGLVTWLKRRHL